MNSSASIYIPRMSVDHTEESIAYYMSAHYNIGTISHVDFTPINKKPGFGENVSQVVKSAFVHFSDPWFCSDKLYSFQRKNYTGNSTFWNTIAAEKSYKIQVSYNEYWICLKNKNPVQRTMMNIHQVVENGRHLENLITNQAEEIKNLKETVEELQNTLKGVHNVVHQLVGGLYCQRNQESMIRVHLKHLGFGNEESTIEDDTHPHSIWPTTRQGDENAEKIKKLEGVVNCVIKQMLQFHENCFVEDDDDVDFKEIPNNLKENDTLSEISDGSSDLSERMKNSYDLCGV